MIIIKLIILSIFTILLTVNPVFADSYQSGIQAYSQQDYGRAEQYFKNALSLSPNNSNIRYYLAITLVRNSKLTEAKKEYYQIINTAPNTEAAQKSIKGLYLIEDIINGKVSLDKTASTGNRLYSSNSQNDTSKVTLNIDNSSSAIFVKNAVINNHTYANFILDTGATFTSISTSLAKRLGISTASAPKVTLTTANGTIKVPVVTLNSITINGLTARNVKVTVQDIGAGNNISGLLGLSFLNNFKLTIDKANGKLILEKS